MKKSIRNVLILLMLIALIIPITYSYAIGETQIENKQKSFFETSKLEYSKNEKVEITINLEEIKYNKFIFELESSENMQNIEINSNESNKTLNVEKSENELVVEIDKQVTNLSNITLYYQIPEQMQINDTIKFTATVTNTEIQEKEDEDIVVEPETETKTVEIKIVEQKAKQDTENEKNNQFNNNNEVALQTNMPSNTERPSNQGDINNNSNLQKSSMNLSTNSIAKDTQTVTYNGSDNNYLTELTVEGYELNKQFSKDNSTYFLTVENTINSLNIETNTDEDTATVCVYGNENLSEGTNKILISVTAENGNVRNYRIYVTKNS